MGYYPDYVASSPDQVLAYPHHSDPRWKTARLIYGQECKCGAVEYSDRLWEWDWDAADHAGAVCKAAGLKPRTARYVETWLAAYHGRPITLRYIMGGSNWSTGYDYYVYGYDFTEARS